MAIDIDAPDKDVIEVSLFSRGYGEAIAVHVGEERWLLIDSLKTIAGTPASLDYLTNINVDFDKSVEAILLTHWHDDHVAGAGDMVRNCNSAEVIISGALQSDEFKAFLRESKTESAGSFGSGVEELISILRFLRANKKQPRWAWADKNLSVNRSENPYRFEALSPSEKDFENLVLSINNWAQTSGRLKAPSRNDASVAAVVSVANELVLLGADLEVRGHDSGWAAVHANVWKDRGRASFFKVAHHGSVTGEYAAVWADMLVKDVAAALTPWSRGSKLPTQTDVDRILAHSQNAHAASKMKAGKTSRRSNTVEKSLREADIKVLQAPTEMGHLRFRKRTGQPWDVKYVSGGSCHLSEVLALQ